MAQLSDDCFANRAPLMTTAEALALLNERIVTVADAERVVLDDACGRILSETVTAPISVPRHDNSAVDGYAVFFDDLDPDEPTRLPVTGRAARGTPAGRRGETRRSGADLYRRSHARGAGHGHDAGGL